MVIPGEGEKLLLPSEWEGKALGDRKDESPPDCKKRNGKQRSKIVPGPTTGWCILNIGKMVLLLVSNYFNITDLLHAQDSHTKRPVSQADVPNHVPGVDISMQIVFFIAE